MTQKRYTEDILPAVQQRKKEVKASDQHFIFQEDNDESNGTRSKENIARYKKIEMKLNYIDD